MQIRLTQNGQEQLGREVTGQGGAQTLLRRFQQQVDGDLLSLTPEERDQAEAYTKGEGGWQRRFLAILEGEQLAG